MAARLRRLLALMVIALLTVPATAQAKAAPTSGTWAFTDMSPDPTSTPNDATMHCHGALPTAPGDVNSYALKLKKPSRVTLTAHNMLDWAMEVRDSSGNPINGTDGADLTTPENLDTILPKGTYEVVYCNMEGEPEITVDWEISKI